MSGMLPGEELLYESGAENIKFLDHNYEAMMTNLRLILSRQNGATHFIHLKDFSHAEYFKEGYLRRKGKIVLKGIREIKLEGNRHELENISSVISQYISDLRVHQIPPEGLVGEVRDFQPLDDGTRKIWNFRLARFDEDGNELPLVSVEMSGTTFDGYIKDGDRVSVFGGWTEGRFVKTHELYNLTTGNKVIAS